MITKKAEYTVYPESIEQVFDAIGKFVNQIKHYEKDTVYQAFHIDGTYDFIHIMKFPSEEAEKFHMNAAYTLEFVNSIFPFCTNEPEFKELNEIF